MFYFILESYLHLRLNLDIASQVGHKVSAVVCRLGICKLSDYTLSVHFIPIFIQICVIGYNLSDINPKADINHMVVINSVFIPKANINHMVVYDGYPNFYLYHQSYPVSPA